MKSDYFAYSILVCTMVIWGITDPLGKWMVRNTIGPTIPPVMIGFIRYFFGALAFFAILKYKENSIHLDFVKKNLTILVIMGLLSVTIYQIAYLYGLDYTAASDASLIMAVAPAWVLLLTFVFFKESLTLKKGLGVIISFLGAIIIIEYSPNTTEPNRVFGDCLILLSILAYASYGVVLQYMLKSFEQQQQKPSTLTIITWVSFFGFIGTAPFLIVLSPNYILDPILYLQIPMRIWEGIIFLVVFATVIANLFIVEGITLIKASRTAIFANLIPLIAIITSALFLGERFDPVVDSLSFIFIVGGVYFVNSINTKELESIVHLENDLSPQP